MQGGKLHRKACHLSVLTVVGDTPTVPVEVTGSGVRSGPGVDVSSEISLAPSLDRFLVIVDNRPCLWYDSQEKLHRAGDYAHEKQCCATDDCFQ